MKTEYGWTGKILRVDLTNRKWWVESTGRYSERFIGGIGIGLKIFWDEVNPQVGAFDPENKLVFATGPLTGTLAPASGRFEVVSKSSRSYPRETVTRSGLGGFWGPELKFSGYDVLVVEGASDKWLNLWIHDDTVEFKDASEYMGRDTFETQIGLRRELGAEVKILCIGPAGERLSRLAVILSETSFASGRSGFGAVMGAKKLKAIAVRGTKPLRVFDTGRLIEASKKVRALSARNPIAEWTTRVIPFEPLKDRAEYLRKYRKRNTGCFGCHFQCFAYLAVPDAGETQTHCTNYFYYPHATRYYGDSLERDQAVSDGYVLSNRLGMDTFEFRHMTNFLDELYQAKLIETRPEIPLDKIGSREFVQKLLNCIAMREGLGDLLAEGTARAADRIKGGWEYCAKYFPAYGSALHGVIRNHPGIALLWSLDSRCPIIDQHLYIRIAQTHQKDPAPYTLSVEDAQRLSKKVFGSDLAINHSTFQYKPEAAIYAQNRSMVINLLVVCDWVYPLWRSYVREDQTGDTSLESQLFEAVTGRHIEEEELSQMGERVWNLGRAIMVQEGRTRDDDTLHESFFRDTKEGQAISYSDFENSKTVYYQLRGWDPKTGWPTSETLRRVGLSDVAEGLTGGPLKKKAP